MANVYVVTRGEYSDRMNIAIFSDEKKAERVKDIIGGNDIEVYELDPTIYTATMPHFTVFMERDGSIKEESIYEIQKEDAINHNDLSSPMSTGWQLQTYGENTLCVECYARNKDHAIKIANEYRIQLLATGIYNKLHPNGEFRLKNYIDKDDVDIIITLQFEEK